MIKQSFEQGFYKRAAEYGLSKEAVKSIDLSKYSPDEKAELLDIVAPHIPKHMHEKIKHLALEHVTDQDKVNKSMERFLDNKHPGHSKADGWHHIPLKKRLN